MEGRNIEHAISQAGIRRSNGSYVLRVILLQTGGQDRCTWQPPAQLDAKGKVSSSSGRPAVPIDEWVYEVQPPKDEGCQLDGISSFPPTVDIICKVLHQPRDLKVRRRQMLPYRYLTRPKLAGARVQTRYGMEV